MHGTPSCPCRVATRVVIFFLFDSPRRMAQTSKKWNATQVHPGAWLVHRPHEDTKVRKVVAREASNVNKLGIKLPKNALYYKV